MLIQAVYREGDLFPDVSCGMEEPGVRKVGDDHRKSDDNDSEPERLEHTELVEISATILDDILKRDTLLNDLPKGVTVEEVNSQIALEHGQSITVYVRRDDGEEMPVVVQQRGATVLDLKRAIQRYFSLKLARDHSSVKISWKYVWRSNYLYFKGQKLTDNLASLEKYGISNRCRVSFVKRLREKETRPNMYS